MRSLRKALAARRAKKSTDWSNRAGRQIGAWMLENPPGTLPKEQPQPQQPQPRRARRQR